MKFKQFLLDEKYINTNKEYFFLLDGRIPLAPKLWSRISEIKKIPLCYHTTDLKGLGVIKKLQGKKKQISTFTKGDATVAVGVDTKGGILIELSGESTLALDGDAWTSLDRSGTRWWDLKEMSNGKIPEIDLFKNKVTEVVHSVLVNKFSEYVPPNIVNTKGPSALAKAIEDDFPQKEKGQFIKLALDAVEKYIKKNSKEFENIIKLANAEGKKVFGSTPYFNEVVLHNFKILNVYGIVPYRGDSHYPLVKLQKEGKVELDGWTYATYVEDIDNGKVSAVKNVESLS